MKQTFLGSLFLAFALFIALPNSTHAQTLKSGDVVYFQMHRMQERYYFSSSVYIVATVKSVIGSNAILDTELYLYQCTKGSSYWQIGTKLSIARRSGMGQIYLTWKARDNKGYRWPTKHLKKYDSKVEKAITKGKIRSTPLDCSVMADT